MPLTMHMPLHMVYALPALPLAAFALPVYVHVPKLYVDHVGLSLTLVGALLLLARLIDAGIDPLIGRWCETRIARVRAMWLGMPLLLAGGAMLFLPPAAAGAGWLLLALLLAYGGYALASINHQALGAEYPQSEDERLRANAWREGATLLGVMLASILPVVLADTLAQGLAVFFVISMPLLLLSLRGLRRIPVPVSPPVSHAAIEPPSLWHVWRDPSQWRLYAVATLNGIAAALPATLVLFYVSDVLVAEAWSGAFLLLYFAAGVAAMPLWVRLAMRHGRVRAWQMGMALALCGFLLAPWLGQGDVLWFALVCLISGLALGADLVLPPALLAEQVARAGQAALRYGWWATLNKLNLALAAGIALPLAAWLGYVPGDTSSNTVALAWLYGGLPLLLKLMALLALRHSAPWLRVLDRHA